MTNLSESVGRSIYQKVILERSYGELILLFCFVIIIFGIAYAFLPSDDGIVPNSSKLFWSKVFQGIYFSIVTITSLGYGDIYPTGISRILAGIEVILGLSLIGIIIAKFTSERVSHLVSSLYVSDMQRNFDKFTRNFEIISADLRNSLRQFSEFYEEVPSASNITNATPTVETRHSKKLF